MIAAPTLVVLAVVLARRRLHEPGRGHLRARRVGVTGEVQLLDEEPASPEESPRLVQRIESLRRLFFAMPFLAVAFVGFGPVAREL